MATSGAIRPSMGAIYRISSTTAGTASMPLATTRRAAAAAASSYLARTQTASISTTAALLKRHTYVGARDNMDHSKKRGESAIRRTGTRWRLSMSDVPLPKPVPRDQLPPIETDPNHGLWEFFADRQTVAATPEQDAKHGRSWTVEELRHKSWDDLHRLWWVCVKERNRIATANWERNKSRLGFGEGEALERDHRVRDTMRCIKHVLTERFYAWEDAVKLAENDPEVNLSGDGPAFTPSDFLLEEEQAAGKLEQPAVGSAEEAVEKAEAAAVTPDPTTIPPSKPQSEASRL
ncbi:54S ribosomal protein L4 mitochondrial [Madurella fahalii]|uniref:Large ribosomal subunit protein uL29m n=1 Tax=Madurella fahalii TaxID=1157608 RepID=A0ABQ0GM27_9PEZI